VDWTLTFALPRTITVNLEFVPWLVVGYLFWGFIASIVIMKAENNSGRYSGNDLNTGSDWALPFASMFLWPAMLYGTRKDTLSKLEELEDGGDSQ
jgi:hypothetical protein